MNIKDIKEGETYNVRIKVNGYNLAKTAVRAWDCSGVPCFFKLEDLSPISPAPKYAPCRKFRKGDKVRLIEWNGRKPFDTHHGLKLNLGEVHIVLDDEYERNEVYIGMSAADEEQSVVHACNLEIITSVEELEPYYVEDVGNAWAVRKPESSDMYSTQAWFSKERHPHAKAAAEAECARLNAENRKEQA